MRLIYLSQSIIPSKLANSVHIMKMCNALSSRGADVTLLAFPGNENLEADVYDYYGITKNVKIKYIPWTSSINVLKLFFYHFSNLYSLIYSLRNKFDYYFGRHITPCFFLAIFGRKTVIELHQPPETLTFVQKYLIQKLSKNKNLIAIVVITNYLKSCYIDFNKNFKDKIIVAADAADEIHFDDFSYEKQQTFQVGYVGHLYKGRGMEIIVEIAKIMKHVQFNIIGGMDVDVTMWRGKCSQYQNIKFFGFVTPYKAREYMLQQDLLLAPYLNKVSILGENDTSKWMSPLKIFEYMASKKPIVCSNLIVLKDVLKNNHDCLMCDPENIDEWIKAIELLSKDQALKEKLANNAYDSFMEKYTWDSRANKILRLFELSIN